MAADYNSNQLNTFSANCNSNYLAICSS